ncbi:hypothetical protein [Paeniglutamicibacter antarcticus]|uniref:Antitoxin Xre/MbcA/ParS-like toxin-binding domain-containing protein n=1 Tax=Paeniglutamicibacter antarcticus TaxID=494023 RepID=A0ABP9TIR1_9MICC
MKPLNQGAVYTEATQANIHDVVSTLLEAIGTPAVVALSGALDGTAPGTWARQDGSALDTGTEQRLRLGYRVWLTLQSLENQKDATDWLISANPALDEDRPVDFISRMAAQQVMKVAEKLVTGVESR